MAVVVVLVDDCTALHDGRQIDIDVLVGGPIACSDNDGDDDDNNGSDDVDDDESNVLPVVSVCTENSILPYNKNNKRTANQHLCFYYTNFNTAKAAEKAAITTSTTTSISSTTTTTSIIIVTTTTTISTTTTSTSIIIVTTTTTPSTTPTTAYRSELAVGSLCKTSRRALQTRQLQPNH